MDSFNKRTISAATRLYLILANHMESKDAAEVVINFTLSLYGTKIAKKRVLPYNPSVNDEDVWLTAENGQHFLLGEGGEIKAGFGGKFTGKKPSEAFGQNNKQSNITTEQEQPKEQNAQQAKTNTVESPVAQPSSEISNAVEPANSAAVGRRGHVAPNEYFGENASVSEMNKKLSKELSAGLGRNVTAKEAGKMWDSTAVYTGKGYKRIRQAFTDPKNASPESIRQLKQVDEMVKGIPKWEGGPLYRGINVDNKVLESFSVGSTIDMKGPSSWSSARDTADSFTHGDANRVIFSIPSTKKAASINHLSSLPKENEVLAPSDAQYTIKGINKKKVKGRTIYNIDLEENS